MRTITPSQDIALEHCLWAKFQGLSPRSVIRSVGSPVLHSETPDWSDALASVQAAQFLLQSQAAE